MNSSIWKRDAASLQAGQTVMRARHLQWIACAAFQYRCHEAVKRAAILSSVSANSAADHSLDEVIAKRIAAPPAHRRMLKVQMEARVAADHKGRIKAALEQRPFLSLPRS